MNDITIVGAGASGIIALTEFLRYPHVKKICIVEREANVGGIAYTDGALPGTLMNTQIGVSSLFADLPNHLFDWLNAASTNRNLWPIEYQKRIFTKLDYCPRHLYGIYLQHIFHGLLELAKKRNVEITIQKGEVIDIEEDKNGQVRVVLDDHSSIQANAAFLGLGQISNKKLPLPIDPKIVSDKNIISEVWNKDGLKSLREIYPDENVLCIGTGLSALDVIMYYIRNQNRSTVGNNGTIYAISRHGIRHPTYPDNYNSSNRTLLQIELPENLKKQRLNSEFFLSSLKEIIIFHLQKGYHPEQVFEAIRQSIIKMQPSENLSEAKLYELFKSIKHYDIYRTGVSSEVDAFTNNPHVEILSGKIEYITYNNKGNYLGRFEVKVSLSNQTKHTIYADKVVNTTGFGNDIHDASIESKLITSLGTRFAPHPSGIGFDTTRHNQLIRRDGKVSNIYIGGALATGKELKNDLSFGAARSIGGLRLSVPPAARYLAASLPGDINYLINNSQFTQKLNTKAENTKADSKPLPSCITTKAKL